MSSETNRPLLKAGKEGNRAHEFRDLRGEKRQQLEARIKSKISYPYLKS